jgi:hypothetical protein
MEKKKRDFVWLIVLALLVYISAIILGQKDYTFPFPPKASIFPLMIIVLVFFYHRLYRVTSNYLEGKFFRIFYAVLLITQFVLTGFASRECVAFNEIVGVAVIAYLMDLISMSIIFYVIIKDMFANKHDITYGLLAATCAYLIIPVIFAYVYALLGLHNPALLNVDASSIRALMLTSFQTSHYIVAGFDIPEPMSDLIRSIGVLESFMANLYIVFVVGRLMINSKD